MRKVPIKASNKFKPVFSGQVIFGRHFVEDPVLRDKLAWFDHPHKMTIATVFVCLNSPRKETSKVVREYHQWKITDRDRQDLVWICCYSISHFEVSFLLPELTKRYSGSGSLSYRPLLILLFWQGLSGRSKEE